MSPIRALVRKRVPACSRRGVRSRSTTCHHERAGVVSSCFSVPGTTSKAAPEHSYPCFKRPLDAGRLLPRREDVTRVVESRRLTSERALIEQVPTVRTAALEQPGEEREVNIGGRVRVRVGYENGDIEIPSPAPANRLLPGQRKSARLSRR